MRALPEKILLITDGLPSDQTAALRWLEKLPKVKIQYTQVILRMENDQGEITLSQGKGLDGYAPKDVPLEETFTYSGESYEAFLREQKDAFHELAQAAKGDQVLLLQDRALVLVSLEITDRWLGGLSVN